MLNNCVMLNQILIVPNSWDTNANRGVMRFGYAENDVKDTTHAIEYRNDTLSKI